jgi:hypothetical protein
VIRQIAARVCGDTARMFLALGRWLAEAAQPVARKGKCSWFGCNPDTLHAALPRDPDQEEADAWQRAHFRINGQPLP